jgi:putative DNA-invertase from lambdoid prophage Rac
MSRRKEVKPGRVLGYGRASTEEQETTLVGQEEAVRRAYELRFKDKGYAWGGMYIDKGISGSVPLAQRPEGYKLCCEAQAGDVVALLKLDRGWRNAADFCSTHDVWRAKGVKLVLLDMDIDTSSPMGEAMVQMLATFSQFERRQIGERMKEHWATRRRMGLPMGGTPPYGYKRVGPRGKVRLVPDPAVRALGSRILGWIDAGWTYEEVYFHLLEQRVNNPRTGKEMTYAVIRNWSIGERRLRATEAARKASDD